MLKCFTNPNVKDAQQSRFEEVIKIVKATIEIGREMSAYVYRMETHDTQKVRKKGDPISGDLANWLEQLRVQYVKLAEMAWYFLENETQSMPVDTRERSSRK